LNEIRKKLAKAIHDGDFNEVVRLGRIAKDFDALQGQEKQLGERRRALIAAAAGVDTTSQVISSKAAEPEGQAMSPQQRGNSARATFVQHLAKDNVLLRRAGGKRFRTQSGFEVGIAYASELEIRPDCWFLGLVDEHFDFIVLLCESSSSQMHEFIIPPTVVKEIWTRLSRSHGQVKFHVVHSGANYELRIPGGQLLPINQYLGKLERLK
jgi:hypothetical protein